ncbi:hypothetical protein DBR43_02175 [Pedobacter sp. KBW06]|nr:hypothetical protein DBR43_02175 [Pedobacter sp. KBW06]
MMQKNYRLKTAGKQAKIKNQLSYTGRGSSVERVINPCNISSIKKERVQKRHRKFCRPSACKRFQPLKNMLFFY